MVDDPKGECELEQQLCLCAQGDKAAFKALYDATSVKFYAIILRMVKDPDLTHDILQKAYFSIWKNAGSFDPEKGKAFTWMLVVTRNRAIDVLRQRTKLVYTDCLDETVIDDSAHPESGARDYFIRRRLDVHLNKLPKHVVKAISMNVVYGHSSREIAEHMNVPLNTAKSWVRRGLQSLREGLQDEAFETFL